MKSMPRLLVCLLSWILFCSAAMPAEVPTRVALTRLHTDPSPRDSRPVLVRELFRQAFLLSMRHEFGLQTVDEVMGNEIEKAYDALLVKPHMSIPADKELAQFALFVEEESNPRWLLEVQSTDPDRDIGIIASEMEEHSRTVFPGLMRAWYPEIQSKSLHEPPTPEDQLDELKIEQDLMRFELRSQMTAVRKLHRAINEFGESPTLLSQIARAYANLYQLTPPLPNGLPQAFAARAMLYGNRAEALFPNDDQAVWARGYAYVMAGSINPAARNIAHKKEEQPDWMEIARYTSLFDARNLDLICQDEESDYRSTAAHALHLIWPISSAQWRPTMQRLKEYEPLNFTIDVAQIHHTGVGIRGGAIRNAIEKWKEVVTTFARSEEAPEGSRGRRSSYRELIDSIRFGDDEKNSEFNGSTVAQLLDDYGLFLHLMKIKFEVHLLGVDATESTEMARNLFGSHRNWELMELMRDHKGDMKSPAMVEKISRQRWLDSTPIGNFVFPFYEAQVDSVVFHLDAVNYYSQWRRCSTSVWEMQSYAHWMFGDFKNTSFSNMVADSYIAIAPDSPHAHYILLTDQWEKYQSRYEEWKDRFADHPAGYYFPNIKAFKLERAGKREESIPFRLEAIRMNPVSSYYALLAESYSKMGDKDRWAKTLEDSLQHDPGDLTIHRTQTILANYYCDEKKDPERALPFAISAAESVAGWAIDALVNVYEKLDKWDQAEELRMQNTMRYDLPLDWYMWCVFHNRGNVESAKRYALQAVPNVTDTSSIYRLLNKFALSLFFDRKLDRELEDLLVQKSTGPWSILQLYIYHKKRSNSARCEELLEDLKRRVATIEADPKSQHKLLASFSKTVCELIDRDASPQEWKATLMPTLQPTPDFNLAYFCGAFLELQGDLESAKECYSSPVDPKAYGEMSVTMSRLALKRLQ